MQSVDIHVHERTLMILGKTMIFTVKTYKGLICREWDRCKQINNWNEYKHYSLNNSKQNISFEYCAKIKNEKKNTFQMNFREKFTTVLKIWSDTVCNIRIMQTFFYKILRFDFYLTKRIEAKIIKICELNPKRWRFLAICILMHKSQM